MNVRHLGDILGRDIQVVCRDMTMEGRLLSVKDNWLSIVKSDDPESCYFIPYAAVQYIHFHSPPPAGH